ncbi:MAG: cache domain-containing protein [Alphaproteobacteria bacterium]
MSRIFRPLALAAIVVIGLSGHALAEGMHGTAEEAKALVARAIAAFDERGEAAFAEITAPSTAFRDRDLYVFVIGPDHKTVAHGGFADRVGRDVREEHDVDGKAFGEEFVERATAEGAWVDYKFNDPQSGKLRQKSSWLVLHDSHIFGCGIYKE